MIPIVERDEAKNKHYCWKEARLSIVHEHGRRSPKFGAVFQGTVDEAGQCLLNTAIFAGFGPRTQLHAVGDGAPWIAEQVQDKFGKQGYYLLDFYHVCEYLAAASPYCAQEQSPKAWLEDQKTALKNNDYQQVLQTLEAHLAAEDIKQAPVGACCRYLSNRKDQLDYKTALENDLPIGSGEIESAHQNVIQERLKLPGAWWKATHADSMLALRIVRANQQWDDYWQQAKAA
ncbi:MAG: UPF0236 family protein [Pseudomonadota bacterium]|nr:UPF0236 family protein [Pseudomonadota bacterium]